MCGILGEFAFGGRLTEEAEFRRILQRSVRRGPDYQGVQVVDSCCQVGHNRLAILDLSPNAHQPMQSPSGRYWLVYNGEVYNHLELREWVGKDIVFHGNSDTETLAVAIDRFGVQEVVERCDGMFALGVYDRQDRCLWLARDFAGIKPLFYAMDGGRIVFASQYDQVVAFPTFHTNAVDPQVLRLYLEQHFLPAPFGLHQGTGQLMPGELMRIEADGQIHRHRFWEFPEFVEPTIREREEALEIVSAELEAATRAELMADVPLGAFLSGGIDSPLVCYFARKHTKGKFKAFSIGSDSKVHDESEDATAYARLMDIEHHLEKMDASAAVAIMDRVAEALREPMADFSIVPTWLVSRLARSEVKVALSGDGGDELFFGYERFWSVGKNIRFQGLPYALKYGLYGIDRVFGKNKHINSAVLFSTQGVAHQGLHSRFDKHWLEQLFPDLRGVSLPESYCTYAYPRAKDMHELVGYMRKAEFYGMMQKTLRKVDLASMDNSLEVRVPFLKKSFIEASLKIDPWLSFGPDKKKELLKQLLKSKLPAAPIDNRKRGFSVPLGQWMRQQLREHFEEVLLNAHAQAKLGIQRTAVETMWCDHLRGVRDYKWPLFTLYALLQWDIRRDH